jgi:hypothetical protein
LNSANANEVVRLGGDPTDEVWVWLITRGPHGISFTWGASHSEPPNYVGVVHLQEVVRELRESVPEFEERARNIVSVAMRSELAEIARRAIQVAAVIGGDAELEWLKQLLHHPDPSVSSDARAALFYLKHRARGG